eukprot:TRINITY_DN37494_c0_g1_i1.p1 TRINITY_DN37494_c0_g1~~TRINITY_DN37494_c0_g1_i1.p1  ORF type:complete len:232 (-),score=43.00 TRINITY_DN37494_c0_g1_i1:237-932(-)
MAYAVGVSPSRSRRLRSAATKRRYWQASCKNDERHECSAIADELKKLQHFLSYATVYVPIYMPLETSGLSEANGMDHQSESSRWNDETKLCTQPAVGIAGVAAEITEIRAEGYSDTQTPGETAAEDPDASAAFDAACVDGDASRSQSCDLVEPLTSALHLKLKRIIKQTVTSQPSDTWEALLEGLQRASSVQKAAQEAGQTPTKLLYKVMEDILQEAEANEQDCCNRNSET